MHGATASNQLKGKLFFFFSIADSIIQQQNRWTLKSLDPCQSAVKMFTSAFSFALSG